MSEDAPGLGFAGYVVEVLSYTVLRAHVYQSPSRLLRYGALAYVYAPQTGRSYLALVTDVAEKTPVPLVSQQAVQQLYEKLAAQGVTLEGINRVMQQLLSPTQSLVRWYSVREITLRVLGEVVDAELRLPEEPPRPLSIVTDPDPGLLSRLLTRGGGQALIPLGELAYNPGVVAALDPRRLNTHMAVLGQTGAGKSETVKRLAAEYAWRKHLFSRGGGVVVMDVSGEYSGYPYRPPGGATLLEAVLRPGEFTSLDPQWLRGAAKTVFIPYDLATVTMYRAGDEDYAARVGGLVDELRGEYPGEEVVGLLYGRHGVYRVDGSESFGRISRGEAESLLGDAGSLLVVAAPLPDSMGLDAVYELSGTRSEQFPLALAEIADRLGLLDVESIASISALAAVVEAAWRLYGRVKSATKASGHEAVDKACRMVRELVEKALEAAASAQGSPEAAVSAAVSEYRIGYVPPRALLNLAALPLVRRDPSAGLTAGEIRRALEEEYPVQGTRWRGFLARGVEAAARELLGLSWQTAASIVRAMRRVSRMTSPYLDASQYRRLVERLAEGFTIVHLAPPSRGDTSPHVARLLDELFTVSTRSYDPSRRTLLVVEEAHNLAPADEDTASKRALLRIAREGRKWGLSLVLVSQRPGFIDPDILSQAATLAALRITNPDDLAGLRRSVESTSQETIERLPDLDPGQAVISGPAVPERRIPLLVRVSRLEPLQPGRRGGGG